MSTIVYGSGPHSNHITITRCTHLGDYTRETIGLLTFNDFTCYTIENPWNDNIPYESCIPEGDYYLHFYTSPKFGDSVIIYGGTVSPYDSDKSIRSTILIHAANTARELSGCIGLGNTLGVIDGMTGVMNSRNTVREFLSLININEVYTLNINYGDLTYET